jgi:hypothetical protein
MQAMNQLTVMAVMLCHKKVGCPLSKLDHTGTQWYTENVLVYLVPAEPEG